MCTLSSEELKARTYFYALANKLVANRPSEELAEVVDADQTRKAIELLGMGEQECMRQFTECLGLLADVDARSKEYSKLLIGFQNPVAPPWESVYAESGKVVFGPGTVSVRRSYENAGMVPRAYPPVADDHIAQELRFLGELALQMWRSAEGGNEAAFEAAREATSVFLRDHLLKWVGYYARDLATKTEEADRAFYPKVAAAIASFAKADFDRVA